MRKVRIHTILGFILCKTLPTFTAFCSHVALLFGLCKLAHCFPAKDAACRSLFALAQSMPYAVSRNQGATPPHFTKLAYTYLQPGTTRSSLSSGKLSVSLRRQTKGAEKGCAHARLLRGVKHADLHTYDAIPGLVCGAKIRGLRKKI